MTELGSKRDTDKREYWLYGKNVYPKLSATWGKVKFPVIDLALGAFYFMRTKDAENSQLRWMNQTVLQLKKIGLNHSGRRRIRGPVETSWASDDYMMLNQMTDISELHTHLIA